MSTNFPTSIDTNGTGGTLNVQASTTALATGHVSSHQNLTDSVIALETKVGADSSAVTSTIDYKLKSTSSVDPGHKHTTSSITLALTNLTDTAIVTPASGNVLTYNGTAWANATTSAPDASTTVKGVSKLSVAPASASSPIVVGANNSNSGTVISITNNVEDVADTSATSAASKLLRMDGSGKIDIATILSIASMAQGDLFYASSSSAIARLGAGTSGQFLKTSGTSANPSWASLATAKFGTLTRTTASGTGPVAVTGIGFQPSTVLILSTELANSQTTSLGFTDGSTNVAIYAVFNSIDASNCINTQSVSGDTAYWTGTIGTFASDGFTVNYLKVGTGQGDFTGYYIALR